MNSISKEKIVIDNYDKFKKVLTYIITMLKESCVNNFSFKVTLHFQTMKVEKLKFDIKCLYTLEIPNEDNIEFKDENILFIPNVFNRDI